MNKPGTGWETMKDMDREVDKILRKMRERQCRVLIFTSYPLGKGRAFVVDPEGAKK